MKKSLLKKIFFLLLIASTQSAFAQVIDIATIQKEIITGKVMALVTDTLIPREKILSGIPDSGFRKLVNDIFIFKGYNDSNYLFRFIVSNHTDEAKNAILSTGPTGIKDGELFQVHNGVYNSLGKTGYKYSFKKRPYQYMHYAYPIQVEANSTDTFFFSTQYFYAYKTFGFALGETTVFKAFENKVYLLFGLIIGLLFLFLVFNVYVYVSLKERVHIWYALYIALQILIVFKNDQLDDQFLGTDSESGYRMLFLMGIGPLSIGILMHVVQLYLRNIKHTHWLYRVTMVAKWNLVISALLQIVVYYFTADLKIMNFLFHWTEYSAIVGVILIIINCIYSAFNGFRSAFFILIGIITFLVGAFQKLQLTPTESLLFPPDIFHLGMIMEVIIISFGFIYSYRLERRESRTMERNFSNEMQKAKEEIQEQTFKTISQEIHDNIGQVLTLAKLTINTIDSNNNEETKEKIHNSGQMLSQAIQDLRNLSRSLNADMIMDMGLVNAIAYELDLLRKTGTYTIGMEKVGTEWRLDNKYELILFRIFQETITNIIRHARASKIKVFVLYKPNHFEMSITDDGDGFFLKDTLHHHKSGIGIRNMKNRTKVLGADFIIDSHPGKGTTIKVIMTNVEMHMEFGTK